MYPTLVDTHSYTYGISILHTCAILRVQIKYKPTLLSSRHVHREVCRITLWQVQRICATDKYTRQVQQVSTTGKYTRPVQQVSTTDKYTRQVQQVSTQDKYNRQVQQVSTTYKYTRQVQQVSTHDKYIK